MFVTLFLCSSRPAPCKSGPALMTNVEISELLRRRIMADLHLGRLKPGGRLPSLRTVAKELGVSIRAAARAYADLQKEGLVAVRGRSGIYLVLPQAAQDLSAPYDWYAEMLRDAWLRRIPLNELSDVLEQLVENPMTVACVESTEDHMVAFCAELEEDFALKTKSVRLTDEGARVGDEVMTLYDAFADVDFMVTTAFHAAEVKVAADLLKKPVVVVSVNDTLVDEIERQLANRPITIVAHDPRCVDRFRECLIERFRSSGEMRVVSVDDAATDPNVIDGSTPLYTRAARKQLNEEEYHLLPPPIPFLSANAARKLVQCMLETHRKRSLQTA